MDPLKTFRLESGKSFTQLGEQKSREALQLLGGALYREGQGILAESQGLVPVDTGALRASGYTTEPQYQGKTVIVDIGYGGPAAKINPKTGESTAGYALYVHENLDAFHKVGTCKFLEWPFLQAISGMAARIGDFMRSKGEPGEFTGVMEEGEKNG